jgi:hypothetical protein
VAAESEGDSGATKPPSAGPRRPMPLCAAARTPARNDHQYTLGAQRRPEPFRTRLIASKQIGKHSLSLNWTAAASRCCAAATAVFRLRAFSMSLRLQSTRQFRIS